MRFRTPGAGRGTRGASAPRSALHFCASLPYTASCGCAGSAPCSRLAPAPALSTSASSFTTGQRQHTVDTAPERVQATANTLLETTTTTLQLGNIWTIHGPDELQQLLNQHDNRLVILMCKSSQCKPCRKFMPTYSLLAERFSDSVMLDITGDETQQTRKMMIEMKVKTTPTFFLYRGGQQVDAVAGTRTHNLLKAILQQLKPGEAGADIGELPQDVAGLGELWSGSESESDEEK